jgi:hypothetical protein
MLSNGQEWGLDYSAIADAIFFLSRPDDSAAADLDHLLGCLEYRRCGWRESFGAVQAAVAA